ncbi:hypothetical protein EMIT0357P_100198 [Pseudomonas marginalis]
MKKLLPRIFRVTKAGAYGNEAPAFFRPSKTKNHLNPPVLLGDAKVGTHPAICLVQKQ